MPARLGRRDPVVLLLGAGAAASAAVLLALGSKLTFLLDDWEFLLYRPGFTAHSILDPHGEHISIAPILIYKALLATVGMESSVPYLAVDVALVVATAVLLFVYLRRRVDPWLALLAAALILTLGPAYDDLLWDFQMGFTGSLACGLGAILMLERGDRRGDMLACGLLTAGVTFSSLGLPFIVAAAVDVALREDRLRRLFVFAVPALLYAVWWAGWGHTADTALSLHNVANDSRVRARRRRGRLSPPSSEWSRPPGGSPPRSSIGASHCWWPPWRSAPGGSTGSGECRGSCGSRWPLPAPSGSSPAST